MRHVIRRRPMDPAEFLIVTQEEEKVQSTLTGLSIGSPQPACFHEYCSNEHYNDEGINSAHRPFSRPTPSRPYRYGQSAPPIHDHTNSHYRP
jgi:hypothetical protein